MTSHPLLTLSFAQQLELFKRPLNVEYFTSIHNGGQVEGAVYRQTNTIRLEK